MSTGSAIRRAQIVEEYLTAVEVIFFDPTGELFGKGSGVIPGRSRRVCAAKSTARTQYLRSKQYRTNETISLMPALLSELLIELRVLELSDAQTCALSQAPSVSQKAIILCNCEIVTSYIIHEQNIPTLSSLSH